MEDARILIEVVAGILPGQPMPEYTKRWAVTSKQWEEAEDKYALLEESMKEALEYSNQIRNPNRVNWVRVDWVWV